MAQAPVIPPVNFHVLSELSAPARAALLRRTEADLSSYIVKVAPIVEAVKAEGDVALARFAREFDKATVSASAIAATPDDFARAEKILEPRLREAMVFAAQSITDFHKAQMPERQWLKELRPGVFTGERVSAIPSVACYVPRGKGAFPSSVLMTAIPATVAGVNAVAILTPPGPDGEIDDATLVAASRWRFESLQGRWRAGHRGRGLWHGDYCVGGQDRGTGQSLRGGGQAAGGACGRCRCTRRAIGNHRACR
jgi:histidinol dehydrogenase